MGGSATTVYFRQACVNCEEACAIVAPWVSSTREPKGAMPWTSRTSRNGRRRESFGKGHPALERERALGSRVLRPRGLAEHTFYSRRRELLPENTTPEINHESPATSDSEAPTVVDGDGDRSRLLPMRRLTLRSRRRLSSWWLRAAGLCHCTLELENTAGAKMRIQVRSAAMPDLAAISQSFWNHSL